jgi:transglutaminase-like putative cysteine protease
MGSKTLALVVVALLVVAAFFILDTSSLLAPVLDRLPIHEPEATPQAVLWVNGYIDEANSSEGFYAIAYSVTNKGNTTAQNVTLTTAVNGETRSSKLIPSLEVSESANYSLTISATPSTLYVASLQASCEDSDDSYTFSFGADVPRTFSDNPDQVKLFITPREPTIFALKNELLKDAPLKVKDWIALRNWVGDNIQYKHDNEVYGVPEYWQFGKETISLRTGDCEDFAILLCSLLRSAGYSPNDVYVVIGKNQNGYHAWVKINLDTVGWYNLEPQENGFATIVGDFLTLSDYHALYEFNDQQFHQLS